ncbi:MAG TPA: GNAT family N-acetyltransferase [Rhodocyclaceae bacterium]|nr:GNAT family N-acetyltransferase [Rhodocyclaceae bacterium]
MRVRVSLPAQTLELHEDGGTFVRRYSVSTARNGAGEQFGSFRTPRGRHLVRAKIGAAVPENTVFVRRRPTGDVWTPELAAANPDRDWILTRILWLSGLEPGFNRLGQVDTMRRYIYIHGSPDSVPMGSPGSIGCVRMRNRDIVELFDRVPVGTPVDIVEFRVEEGAWDALGAAARRIREAVFVEEQRVPVDLELDGLDDAARHVVAYGPAGEAVGTGRLLADGHIGRLAVMPAWRAKGVGRALLERLVEAADDSEPLVLHAQTAAAGFYRRFGFVEEGDVFLEADIPHIRMVRSLPA